MSPQALGTNKFAVIPSHNNNCINFIPSTLLFTAIKMHLTSMKKSNICYSTWHLYFWGSVVTVKNWSLELLSKLQFVFAILVYRLIAERKQAFVYNDNHLKLGFASVMVISEIRPQFMLCLEGLDYGSLKEP